MYMYMYMYVHTYVQYVCMYMYMHTTVGIRTYMWWPLVMVAIAQVVEH